MIAAHPCRLVAASASNCLSLGAPDSVASFEADAELWPWFLTGRPACAVNPARWTPALTSCSRWCAKKRTSGADGPYCFQYAVRDRTDRQVGEFTLSPALRTSPQRKTALEGATADGGVIAVQGSFRPEGPATAGG